ncbi:conjugal transfer pilus assembly protein TraU [Gilliamella sp. BG7]|uniref:conjugal transfer pilus assembly protein TraU n=1 Tax=unclassified Gilliamella TaxID=2685620 RepID=UPI003986F9BD
MNKLKCFIFLLFFLSFELSAGAKTSTCTGKFVNPISDVCWKCLFPISIGNFKIGSSPGNSDTPNPSMPIQYCQIGQFTRIGVAIGYWEPSYLVDVTREPYCMVNLGGMDIGEGRMGTGHAVGSEQSDAGAFYNVHWYQYPLVSWLNLFINAGCMQLGDFDVGYFSELDSTWEDDELAAILAPESAMFGNLIAQAACVADATSSMFGMPLDPLFWCAGSHGSLYPFTGHIPMEYSPFQSTLLAAERMAFKMHRQGLVMNTIGANKAVCYAYPSAVIPKSRWRYQVVNEKSLSYRCDAFGRTPMAWEWGLNNPLSQKNYGYLFWRKRNCVYL